MRKIKEVKVLGQYKLEIVFDNRVRGTVDLSALVGKGVFSIWRDPGVFENVQIGSSGELAWSDQTDLCPDSLYLKVTGKKPKDIFPALRCEEKEYADLQVALDRLHDKTDIIVSGAELRKLLHTQFGR